MKMRSWPFLFIGFGALMVLIGFSVVALHNRMEKVRIDVQALQSENERSNVSLEETRAGIYLSAILLRDYLLERSPENAALQRNVLEDLRNSTQRHFQELHDIGIMKDRPEMQRLRAAMEEYWRVAAIVFEWTPAQKQAEGPAFLRRRMAPQRELAFQLASDIENVGLSQSRLRQEQILRTQEDLKSYVRRFGTAALLLGALVAIVSITRTHSLEANAARHLREIERAAADLRRLSLKLSKAQEEERKSISRELHDQVGQMLTALRMELGNIEGFRQAPGGDFDLHMNDAKKLTEETLRTVRDMSMGLRPSVLDQLGLAPALRWQSREFARRSGVPVDIQIDGNLDNLGDAHRTCVYRVVQEALTNCARHAQASRIRVSIHGGATAITLAVEDDGTGFEVATARSHGLGLLGSEERAKELGGNLQVDSQPGKGTVLRCEIPVSNGAEI